MKDGRWNFNDILYSIFPEKPVSENVDKLIVVEDSNTGKEVQNTK